MAAPKKYRLVTRSDFDGLVCAMLLKELKLINEIVFVHPKDMQDGKIPITENDITTNLPYVPGAYLVFDHHASEALRNAEKHPDNYILEPETPSAARVVYNYYGGKKTFPHVSEAMLIAVDKADSAKFTREEILFPKDWVLLNYIMDPRTGLGRYKNFRISNYDLMMLLIDDCKRYSIEQVLNLPDVRERVDLYFEHQRLSMDQIEQCAKGRVGFTATGTNLHGESVYCVCHVSRMQYLHSYHVGLAETKHSVCDGQFDPESFLENSCGQVDVKLWRRWA